MTGPVVATRVVETSTPVGPARAHVHDPAAGRPRSTVVLGHGAGGGVEARDLVALATSLRLHGHRVVLVEQPWRVAGRKVAAAPAMLDVAWAAALADLRGRGELCGSLVVGGRSAGARVACRTAADLGADAVLALAFPLHPPGRPERDRGDELRGIDVPALVVQGGRDPFGSPDEVRAAAPGATVVPVPFADHGLAVGARAPITSEEALGIVVDAARGALAEWGPRSRR